MSYRRREQDTEDRRQWRDWVNANAELIAAAGLPDLVVKDEDHWEDLLDHGHLDHHPDPSAFSVSELSVRQKASLLRLVLNWKVDRVNSVLGLMLIGCLLDAVEQAYDY